MIDGQNFSDQPVGSNMRTYGNNRKIGTGEAVDYTTGCLLDYLYFKDYHQMIAIDLSKKKILDLVQKQYRKSFLMEI